MRTTLVPVLAWTAAGVALLLVVLTTWPAADEGHEHSSGNATTSVTAEQRARADALIAGTKRELRRYADVAAAEAASYRWIGDGAGAGSYRHYVNAAALRDPVVLDPAHVESLVYRNEPGGGLTLVSAMYILPPGTTMAEVPDVAGELSRWHEHTDLCWRADGTIAGTVGPVGCPSGSTALGTPPMLHVWTVDNPAGPFAGIDP
jgi:hypothetical protein